jgi:hypothetical protein
MPPFALWSRSAVVRLPVALNYLANAIVLEFAFGMLIGFAFRADDRLPATLALGAVGPPDYPL